MLIKRRTFGKLAAAAGAGAAGATHPARKGNEHRAMASDRRTIPT